MTRAPRSAVVASGRTRAAARRHPGLPLRLAAILAALAPFAFDPFGLDRWVFPKELCLVAAAVLAWAVPSGYRMPRWWRWWLAVAAAVLGLTALWGAAPLPQFLGRWPRYEGIVTLGAYALAVALGARLWGAHDPSREDAPRTLRDIGATAFAAGLTLAALLAVIEAAGGRPLASDLDRPGSLLGNASDLGVVGVVGLALFLPRAADALASTARRVVPAVGTVAAIVTVLLSASRAALLAAVVVVALTVLAALHRRERRPRWWGVVAAAGVAIIVTALLLPLTAARVFGTSPNAADSALHRLDLWASTLQLIGQHPLTGVGPNGFADALPVVLGDTWFAETGLGAWTESPHDLPLQVLVAGGLLGAATAVGLVVLLARGLRRRGVAGAFGGSALIALVGGGIALLTHFTSPGPFLLLCLLTGAIAAVPTTAPETRPWTRPIAVGGLTVWALALVLALVGDHAFARGTAALEAGRSDDADHAFATAATLRPWDADVPLRAAETYAAGAERMGATGDPATAEAWADAAVSTLPSSTRALLADAVIAQYSGDLPHALDAIRRAVALSPVDPRLRQRLGGLLLLSGDLEAALVELEHAAALAPDDPLIRQTLDYARGLLASP